MANPGAPEKMTVKTEREKKGGLLISTTTVEFSHVKMALSITLE